MNNIKSQGVKTHEVLMYKAANMLFGHLAYEPLTCIQTVIYWNMDMITTVSQYTVTYNVLHILTYGSGFTANRIRLRL